MGAIQSYFCIFIDSVFSAVLGLLLKPGICHIDLCYSMTIQIMVELVEIKDHFSPGPTFFMSQSIGYYNINIDNFRTTQSQHLSHCKYNSVLQWKQFLVMAF